MTIKAATKLPHGQKMRWAKAGEECEGVLIHDIAYSFIDWKDGQRTYTSDDAAMKYVETA